MKPLCVDLFCGLGGWSEGFLAEGYDCVGFDIERHDYGKGGYPGQLVLQDIITLHGSQFKDAACIVASPPCQEYSYMAMPWSRAKQIAAEYRSGVRDVAQLTALFNACFRIQREACEAAGRHIPMIVENVRGAQPWVGRSRWHFGSFHLWGDVPALMPLAKGMKNTGGSWFAVQSNGTVVDRNDPRYQNNPISVPAGVKLPGNDTFVKTGQPCNKLTDPRYGSGTKQAGISGPRANGKGDAWFQDGAARHGSKSNSRKAASAQIAMIPLALSRHIARCFQ